MEHQTSVHQSNLGFVHSTAETTKAALSKTVKKRSQRILAIENSLLMAGKNGLTRFEIANRLNLQIQSVTGPVRLMLDRGIVVETAETRPSPSGSQSKILRLPQFAREVN
jgi:hypothetical protein